MTKRTTTGGGGEEGGRSAGREVVPLKTKTLSTGTGLVVMTERFKAWVENLALSVGARILTNTSERSDTETRGKDGVQTLTTLTDDKKKDMTLIDEKEVPHMNIIVVAPAPQRGVSLFIS